MGVGSGPSYKVVSIADGDTITVLVDGHRETIRLIGVDTPETHKPNTPVQCFGKEASSSMQSFVQGRTVQLEADSSQGDRDRYGRLLRHVFVGGTTNVALAQIEGGFGREYTYSRPYQHRLEYLAAMNRAKTAKRGTWGSPCNGFHRVSQPSQATTATPLPSSTSLGSTPQTSVPKVSSAATGGTTRGDSAAGPCGCAIKGNITSDGSKIAHRPGTATYARTRISAAKGERYFCTEQEAIAAGWRMAVR